MRRRPAAVAGEDHGQQGALSIRRPLYQRKITQLLRMTLCCIPCDRHYSKQGSSEELPTPHISFALTAVRTISAVARPLLPTIL